MGSIFAEGDINLVFWVFAVVGGVLAAITFGAINDRGFKTIKKSAIMGAVSVALLGSFTVILITGCFGYSKRVPAANKIESITVEFTGMQMTVKEPETVLQLHGKIVNNEDNGGDYLNIDYTLKNGRHFVRTYNRINYSNYMPLLLELYKSPEHINSIRSEILGNITTNRSVYTTGYVSADGDENSTEEVGTEEIAVTEAQLKELVEAYISDLPKATYRSITNECLLALQISGVDKNFRYTYISLNVEDTFENTQRVIKKLGLSTP